MTAALVFCLELYVWREGKRKQKEKNLKRRATEINIENKDQQEDVSEEK